MLRMDDSQNDFLAGTAVGILIGASLAVLFAPGKGRETRRYIADAAVGATSTAAELLQRGILHLEAAVGLLNDDKKRKIILSKVADLKEEMEDLETA